MSSLDNEKNPVKKGLTIVEWVRGILEIAAVIVLLFHIFPEQLLEESRKTGALAIYFLGTITVLTIITNYILYYEYRRDLARREKAFNDQFITALGNNLDQERRAKYSKIFQLLNQGFRELHNTHRKKNCEAHVAKEAFRQFCEMLAKVFQELTGKECNVCIKVSILPKEILEHPDATKEELKKVKVKTYVRSTSTTDRAKNDSAKIDHLIVDNTDFEEICFNGGEEFFCNNLFKLNEYKNTTMLALGKKTHIVYNEDVPEENRIKKWKLPYKSVIVAPIVPGKQETEQDKAIIGFLCVDCNDINVFLQDVDPYIVKGCADGIYNPFFQKLDTISN